MREILLKMEPLAGREQSEGDAEWKPPEALEHLAHIAGADAVTELLDAFRTDMVERLTKLRHAVTKGDGATMRIEVHSIKGSAAQMGAAKLAARCRELEIEYGRNEWTLQASEVETLQGLFDEASMAMARHRFAGSPGPDETAV